MAFRDKLLARVQLMAKGTKETKILPLERDKFLYDANVRSSGAIFSGDSVLVRTFVLDPGWSPKLTLSVYGPYPIVKLDRVTVMI